MCPPEKHNDDGIAAVQPPRLPTVVARVLCGRLLWLLVARLSGLLPARLFCTVALLCRADKRAARCAGWAAEGRQRRRSRSWLSAGGVALGNV